MKWELKFADPLTLLDEQESPNWALTFKCEFVGTHLTALCAVLWSSYMKRVTLNYKRLLLTKGIKLICFHCAGLCILLFTSLNTEFLNRYSRAGTSGGKMCVENQVWATGGWQQILRVTLILILSKHKEMPALVLSSHMHWCAAQKIKCHHMFGWEGLLLRWRKVWREVGKRRRVD